MGSFEKFSRSKIWSILKWVYKHTQTDKQVWTHTQCGLLKMGVTTPGSIENYFVLLGVVTPMSISLDLGCIWPDEVYVDEVYDHTRPSRLVCISSMHVYVYIEYVVILILYTIVVIF